MVNNVFDLFAAIWMIHQLTVCEGRTNHKFENL